MGTCHLDDGSVYQVEDSTKRMDVLTELQGNTLEITLGRKLLNLASSSSATCERNLSDLHMRCQQLTSLSSTADDVDHTRRETFLNECSESDGA